MTSRASSTSWRVPEPAEIARWARERWVALGQWLRIPGNAWLAVLLALALLARLSALDLAPFGPEQARWLAQARAIAMPLDAEQMLAADAVPAPGVFTALVALGAGRSRDGRGAMALLALLQWGALVALSLQTARNLGHTPALVVAGGLGLSPWAVYLARNLTPASLTLTVSLLLLAVLLSAILDRNGWAWAASAPLTALALTNDPRALTLGLVWLAALLLYYDRVRWAPLALGVIVAAIVLLGTSLGPALLGTLASSTRDAANGYVEHLIAVIRQSVNLLTGRDLASLTSPADAGTLLAHPWADRLRQLGGLLCWVALPWSAWQAMRGWSRWQDRDQGPERALLALWLWLPLLLSRRLDTSTPAGLALSATGLVIMPATAVAVGLLLARLPEQLRRSGLLSWRWVVSGLVTLGGLCLALNLVSALALPRLAARQDMHLGYGAPYRPWWQAQELVARGLSRSQADQLWVVASGWPAATAEQLFTPTVVLPNERAQLLPAARPALYLLWQHAGQEAVDSVLERLGSRELGAVAFPDGSRALVWELRERSPEELLALASHRVEIHFDAGMVLVGYEWPADAACGAELNLATYWTFENLSTQDQTAEYTLYLALVAPNGQQLVWSEPLALAGPYWQEGLLLRQESTVPLPEDWPTGESALYAEMHRTLDGQPVAILTAPTRPGYTTAPLGQVTINPVVAP